MRGCCELLLPPHRERTLTESVGSAMSEDSPECVVCRSTEVIFPEVFCRACARINHRPECLLCGETGVTYPELLCPICINSLSGNKMIQFYRRHHLARGSVRPVSGGLPSLGKRR
jgi:hypothetical protein